MELRTPLVLLALCALTPTSRAQDREALLKARIKHLEQRVSELEARLARLERLVGPERDPEAAPGAEPKEPPPSPSASKSVRLRQIAQARHGSSVICLAWEPGGKHLVSGAYDETLRVWEGRTGRQVTVLPQRAWPSTVEWDPKGERLVSATMDRVLFAWEIGRDKPLAERSVLGDRAGGGSAWYGPDGSTILYLYRDKNLFAASARTLKDARVGGVGPKGLAFPEDVSGLRYSPDRKRVAINLGKNLSVWDGDLRREQLQVDAGGESVYGFAWSADGRRLACVSARGRLLLWDVTERRLLRELELGQGLNLSFSPDGAWLAIGVGGGVALLDAETLAPSGEPHSYGEAVRAMTWSPDGKVLAVGGKGGKIVVLEVTK